MMMMMMMMMMMRRPSSLRVRAKPRHLPYIYIFIYSFIIVAFTIHWYPPAAKRGWKISNFSSMIFANEAFISCGHFPASPMIYRLLNGIIMLNAKSSWDNRENGGNHGPIKTIMNPRWKSHDRPLKTHENPTPGTGTGRFEAWSPTISTSPGPESGRKKPQRLRSNHRKPCLSTITNAARWKKVSKMSRMTFLE